MIRKVFLFCCLIHGCLISLYGQKVKYKDLIVLLTARDFEKAEPFLKRYLKENTDNPNAFLYMGLIYHDKVGRIDVLTKTDFHIATIDSALLFLDKAYKLIDEKELKKNDEYYEAYTRRDLRTGKFVVKLSDVKLDMETRTKVLKERRENVKLLRAHLTSASEAYEKSQSVFKTIQQKYGSEKEFLLRSNDEMITLLNRLERAIDTVNIAFDQYKNVSKVLGKTGYNQVIDWEPINDLKRDGSGKADFLKDDLKLWDYKSWAKHSIDLIEKEIIPMRENLVTYDIEINKLREKLRTDSVSVKNDLVKLVDRMLSSQLRKYDADPMPLQVFALKISELEYGSNLILTKPLRDSSSIAVRLRALNISLSDVQKMDSISKRLLKRDFAVEEIDYSHFILKAYGTVSVLKNLISTMENYAGREMAKLEKEIAFCGSRLKWIVNATDSIPLFIDSNRDLKFKPLVIEPEKYTVGLVYQDTLATGYLYTVTPSRVPDMKINFPVDQVSFQKKQLPLLKSLAISDDKGQVYFALIYSSEKKEEKFPSTLAKIYRTDGLAWSNNFSLDSLPTSVSYNADSGNLSIKLTASDGSEKIIVVDKTGKLTP